MVLNQLTEQQASMTHYPKIGEYKIDQTITWGISGGVVLVSSPKQQVFAAKLITISNQIRSSCLQEAKNFENINHKNIIKVQNSFLFDSNRKFAVIMEYCKGINLDQLIGKIDTNKIEQIMKAIAEGIDYLHSHKITHKNLSLENILVREDGAIKILGLERLIKQSLLSTAGGNFLYMDPEIQKSYYTESVDIWALGIIFIELAIGKRIDQIKGIREPCKRAKFLIEKIKEYISNKKWLCLILKMLVKEPRDRITIQEVVAILKGSSQKKETSPAKAIKTSQYSDGTYTGEMIGYSREGKGVMVLKDGGRYEGEFKNDKYNGRGVYSHANGDRYEGEFKNDKYNGRGVYSHANGDSYNGDFKDDNKNGRGVNKYASGHKYMGKFKDDMRNGDGVYYYPDENKQEGEFLDDLWHRSTIFTLKDGKKYMITYEMGEIVKEEAL